MHNCLETQSIRTARQTGPPGSRCSFSSQRSETCFGGPVSIQGETIQAASVCESPSQSRKVAWTIVVCVALGGIIADPTTCHAQSPSESTPATSEKAAEADVRANQITNPSSRPDTNDASEEKSKCYRATAADSWGPVPTKKASVAR